MIDHMLHYAMVGAPETIAGALGTFLTQTQADELIISMPIHDIEARLHSVKLFAGLRDGMKLAA